MRHSAGVRFKIIAGCPPFVLHHFRALLQIFHRLLTCHRWQNSVFSEASGQLPSAVVEPNMLCKSDTFVTYSGTGSHFELIRPRTEREAVEFIASDEVKVYPVWDVKDEQREDEGCSQKPLRSDSALSNSLSHEGGNRQTPVQSGSRETEA